VWASQQITSLMVVQSPSHCCEFHCCFISRRWVSIPHVIHGLPILLVQTTVLLVNIFIFLDELDDFSSPILVGENPNLLEEFPILSW
jgi:hypothetical protein